MVNGQGKSTSQPHLQLFQVGRSLHGNEAKAVTNHNRIEDSDSEGFFFGYIYYTGGKMAIMWQKEDYNSFCSVQNMYVNLARLTLTIAVVKNDGQYHS